MIPDDWSQLDEFIDALEGGAELVMGNRFAGGIEAGAMPALHRYLGNPCCRRSPLSSSVAGPGLPLRHAGVHARGLQADGAKSPGMEFASEMVINAHRAGLNIPEVPINFIPTSAPAAAPAVVPRRLAAPATDYRARAGPGST